ncbi:MAG: hypothetical protein ACYC1D_18380 [Acidimicrobiales bacterium]
MLGGGTGPRRAAAFFAAAALVGLALPAAAAAGATSSPAVFGVRPAYTGQTTLHAGHFDYALARGGNVADGIELINESLGVITLHVYGVAALPLAGGKIAPGQPGGGPGSVGRWIHVSRPTVTLLPHRSSVDAFTLAVPGDVPSGDYLGAIVASYGDQAPTGNGLATQTRAALSVHVRVLGHTHLAVTVARPIAHRDGHGELLSVRVTNHGNVVFTVAGAVLVDGGRRARMALSPTGIYVLPGGTATLSATWGHLPFAGHANIRAVIDATVSGNTPHVYTSPTLGLWFIPWAPLGVLVAVLIVVAATNRWWRRWLTNRADDRRVLAAHRAARRKASGAGSHHDTSSVAQWDLPS